MDYLLNTILLYTVTLLTYTCRAQVTQVPDTELFAQFCNVAGTITFKDYIDYTQHDTTPYTLKTEPNSECFIAVRSDYFMCSESTVTTSIVNECQDDSAVKAKNNYSYCPYYNTRTPADDAICNDETLVYQFKSCTSQDSDTCEKTLFFKVDINCDKQFYDNFQKSYTIVKGDELIIKVGKPIPTACKKKITKKILTIGNNEIKFDNINTPEKYIKSNEVCPDIGTCNAVINFFSGDEVIAFFESTICVAQEPNFEFDVSDWYEIKAGSYLVKKGTLFKKPIASSTSTCGMKTKLTCEIDGKPINDGKILVESSSSETVSCSIKYDNNDHQKEKSVDLYLADFSLDGATLDGKHLIVFFSGIKYNGDLLSFTWNIDYTIKNNKGDVVSKGNKECSYAKTGDCTIENNQINVLESKNSFDYTITVTLTLNSSTNLLVEKGNTFKVCAGGNVKPTFNIDTPGQGTNIYYIIVSECACDSTLTITEKIGSSENPIENSVSCEDAKQKRISHKSSGGNDVTVTIKSKKNENSEESQSKPFCVHTKPEVLSESCTNCKDPDEQFYRQFTKQIDFKFSLNSFTYCQGDLLYATYDDKKQYFSHKDNEEYELSFVSDITNFAEEEKQDKELLISIGGYETKVMTIARCIVKQKEEFGVVTLTKAPVDYSDTADHDTPFTFAQLIDLYTQCKYSNTPGYKLYYRKLKSDEQSFTEGDTLSLNEKIYDEELTIKRVLSSGIYEYYIEAINAFGEKFARSETYQMTVCLSSNNVPGVDKFELVTQDRIDIASTKLSWKYSGDLAYRCLPSDYTFFRVEVQKITETRNDEWVTIGRVSTNRDYFIIPEERKLELNTDYNWKISFWIYQNGQQNSASSNSKLFKTYSKSCYSTSCNDGECEQKTPDSLSCKCHSGFRGEFCDKSGLSVGAIAGIATGIFVAAIIVVVLLIIVIRRASFFSMRMPDFTPFMFVMPKVQTGEAAKGAFEVEQLIKEDKDKGYQWGISVLDATPITETENVCRAFVYAYERHGCGLGFLLALIGHEVATAESAELLFRNNSSATKYFKVYSRLVGLPYLFRVMAPLLSKVLKDEEKANAGVSVRGTDITNDQAATVLNENYELNPTLSSSAVDTNIAEASALTVQLTCQMFLSSLVRTSSYCPNEFREICCTVKENVLKRFPNHDVNLALSAFIFLRFFVASLSVPETFGLIDHAPSQPVRRQLILISKVLSNLSTQVKFGDKEDYMVVMNGFIEEKKDELRPFYELLCTPPSSKEEKPVAIPDKFYNASLDVIGYSSYRTEHNEWNKEGTAIQNDASRYMF